MAFSLKRSTSRRIKRSGRRTRGKKRGPSAGTVAVGLAAAAGAAWLGWDHFTDPDGAPAPEVALSIPAGSDAAPAPAPADDGEAPAAPAPGAAVHQIDAGGEAGRPVPSELLGAFTRVQDPGDPLALVDLRRLAIEFPRSPEADQARRTLARERTAAARRAADASPEVALRLMTRAYLATLAGPERRALRPRLEELAGRALFSRDGDLGVADYEVQPGDSLSRIASRQGTDWRLVKRLNGLTSDSIRVGQRLRVPQVAVTVVIFKRDFEVIALLGDAYMRSYDCATGKDDRTPEGAFVIDVKQVHPDWYYNGRRYPYGSEENILGTRWLAFQDTQEHQGFGIHGTKFPESIGTEASMGCIRLRNEDVEVLFDLVPSGSRVRIVR